MSKNGLKKNLLSKVPVQQATGYIISQAKRYEKTDYFIKASVKNINHKHILVLNVYAREELLLGIKRPHFRTFMSKTDYITQYYADDTPKWRTGRFEVLVNYSVYGRGCPVFCDTASERAVDRYLAYVDEEYLKRNAIGKIRAAQNRIMEKRLEKKHAVIIQGIDEKMREVKSLPKDFDHWIDEIAMAHSRYIYYRYSSRKYMDGYCTHCHQEVKVNGIRHRSVGYCPKCGVKVTFLSEGKARYISDQGQAAYFQKTPKGFVIRYFSIHKFYYGDYRNPKFSVSELKRDFYEGGKITTFEYRQFKQTGKTRWCEDWMKYAFPNAAVYTKNLDTVLQDTEFRYSALKEFAQRYDGAGVDPYGYLYRYRNMPELEYFTKAGLYAITYELTSTSLYLHRLQRGKKTLWEILGITKQELRFVQECNMSFWQLSVYKDLQKIGVSLSASEFRRFYDTYREHTKEIYTLLRYTTLYKAENYCRRFMSRSHDLYNVMGIWIDYINFCIELGYDVKNDFVLYPKDLAKAHNTVSADVQTKREKERRKRIRAEERKAKKLLKKYLEIYPWENKEYSIVVPKDLLEIKEEGYALHHCVANYTSYVAEGKSIILFIRSLDKPEKPFYTMELQDNRIIQCRGFGNRSMTDDVERFVKQYEKQVLQKIKRKKVA